MNSEIEQEYWVYQIKGTPYQVIQLPENATDFPHPFIIPDENRSPDGLYAIGGNLNPGFVLSAYSQGALPWTAVENLKYGIDWYCPLDRFVIFPDEIHISHSMKSLLNKHIYTVSKDNDFDAVIKKCSECNSRNKQDGAWLGKEIINTFTRLNQLGYAHSYEVWNKEGELVGGLYGLEINNCFLGESMFSIEPSGSKIALIHMCQQDKKYKFIDCQFETPHLKSMGGRHIDIDEYLEMMYE